MRPPIEVLIPETEKERNEVQSRIIELKELLRNLNVNANAVISDRATYKTTALVQFIAELQMNLEPPKRIGVVCPNRQITEQFAYAYQQEFPTLRVRNPLVDSIDNVLRGCWRGRFDVDAVYAEEIFLMLPRQIDELSLMHKFVGGIGTLPPRPTLAKINNWCVRL